MSTEITRVLVVADSEEGVNYLAHQLLPQAGYEAIVADADTPPPPISPIDVVVVDVTRTLVGPLGPLQTQRDMGCDAPAVLVAPRLSDSMIPQVFSLNVRDFVSRPADERELLDKINGVVQATQQQTTQVAVAPDQPVSLLEQRLQDIETLSQIGRMLTTVDDIDTVLSRIVDSGVYLARAQEGALFMADERGQLYLRAEKNMGQRQTQVLSVMSEDSLATGVFQTGEPVMRGGEHEPLKVKTGYLVQALINVPIIIGHNIVGVLAVYNNNQSPFEETDLRILNALSIFAAIALDKAHTITGLTQSINIASEASRKALITVDVMQSPIEALDAQIDTLLSGALGIVNDNQADALSRMRAAITGLNEVARNVQALAQEFE